MDIKPKEWSIYKVIDKKEDINPKPQYQRAPVWTPKKKQLLIDSILRKYDLPKFYLRASDAPYEHEVVDGQQRLLAIWGYRNDEYSLGEKSKNIPGFRDLSGEKWSDLSSDEKSKIGDFPLTIVEIKDASNDEVQELFLRLQEGVSLNPAEKRNAMSGNMRDFIVDLADHPVFPLTHFSDKRFKFHDLAAIVTCLELERGPTNVKSADLTDMFKNNKQNFNEQGSVAKKVKRILNYVKRILGDKRLAMNIKWGFVDLYLLISKMDELYVINQHEEDFAEFYIKFEQERRGVSDPRELISTDADLWKNDLFDYIQAFKNQGGTKENIDKRHNVYIKRFLKDIQNLKSKDPRRAFTDNERHIIFYRSNGKCQNSNCKKDISIDQMQADHIIPHSRGGQTTLDNAQALCQQCNVKKGAA